MEQQKLKLSKEYTFEGEKYAEIDLSGLENITSNVQNTNINLMSKLKSKIASSHYYEIEFTYDDTNGLVNLVTIKY